MVAKDEGVVAFVFLPVGDGVRDLAGEELGGGTGEVAVGGAVPEGDGRLDCGGVEVPGFDVEFSFGDDGISAGANALEVAACDHVPAALLFDGDSICVGEATHHPGHRGAVWAAVDHPAACDEDGRSGGAAEFSEANEGAVGPVEVVAVFGIAEGRGAAEDGCGFDPVGEEGGGGEGVGAAAGDAEDGEMGLMEVVGEFGHIGGPGVEGAMRKGV